MQLFAASPSAYRTALIIDAATAAATSTPAATMAIARKTPAAATLKMAAPRAVPAARLPPEATVAPWLQRQQRQNFASALSALRAGTAATARAAVAATGEGAAGAATATAAEEATAVIDSTSASTTAASPLRAEKGDHVAAAGERGSAVALLGESFPAMSTRPVSLLRHQAVAAATWGTTRPVPRVNAAASGEWRASLFLQAYTAATPKVAVLPACAGGDPRWLAAAAFSSLRKLKPSSADVADPTAATKQPTASSDAAAAGGPAAPPEHTAAAATDHRGPVAGSARTPAGHAAATPAGHAAATPAASRAATTVCRSTAATRSSGGGGNCKRATANRTAAAVHPPAAKAADSGTAGTGRVAVRTDFPKAATDTSVTRDPKQAAAGCAPAALDSTTQKDCLGEDGSVTAQGSQPVAATVHHICHPATAGPEQQLWKKLAALAAEPPPRPAARPRPSCCALLQQQERVKQCTLQQSLQRVRQKTQQQMQADTRPGSLYDTNGKQHQQELPGRVQQQHFPQELPQLQQQRVGLVLKVEGGEGDTAPEQQAQQQQPTYSLRRLWPGASLSRARCGASAAAAAAATATAAAAAASKKPREGAADDTGPADTAAGAVVGVTTSDEATTTESAGTAGSINWMQRNWNFLRASPLVGSGCSRQRSTDIIGTVAARHAADVAAGCAALATNEVVESAAVTQQLHQQVMRRPHVQHERPEQQQSEQQRRQTGQQHLRRQLPQRQRLRQHRDQPDTTVVKWRGRGGSLNRQIAAQLKKEHRLLSLLVEVPLHARSAEQQQLIEVLQQRSRETTAPEAAAGRVRRKRTRWRHLLGRLPLPYPALLRGLAACSQLNRAMKDTGHQTLRDCSESKSSNSMQNNSDKESNSSCSNLIVAETKCVTLIAREAILDVFYHLPRFPTAHLVRLLRLLALLPRFQLLKETQQQPQQERTQPQQPRSPSTRQRQRLFELPQQSSQVLQDPQLHAQRNEQRQVSDQPQRHEWRLHLVPPQQRQKLQRQQPRSQQHQQQQVVFPLQRRQKLQLERHWGGLARERGRLPVYMNPEKQMRPYTRQLHQQQEPDYPGRDLQHQLENSACDGRRSLPVVACQFTQDFLQDPLLLRNDMLLLLRLRLLLLLTQRVTGAWLRWFTIEELACFVDACASIIVSSRNISCNSSLNGSRCYEFTTQGNSGSGGEPSKNSWNFPETPATAARATELQQKVEQLLQQLQQQIFPLLQRVLHELPWKIDDACVQHLGMLARGFGRLGSPDARLFILIKRRLLDLLAASQPQHHQPKHQQQLQYSEQRPEVQQRREYQLKEQLQHQQEDPQQEQLPVPQRQLDGEKQCDSLTVDIAATSSLHVPCGYSHQNSSNVQSSNGSTGCSRSRQHSSRSSDSSPKSMRSQENSGNSQESSSSQSFGTRRLLEHPPASLAAELNALACICREAVRCRDLYDIVFASATINRLVSLLGQQQKAPQEQQEHLPGSRSKKQEVDMQGDEKDHQQQPLRNTSKREEGQEVTEQEKRERISSCDRQQGIQLWKEEELQGAQVHSCSGMNKEIHQPVEARYVPKLSLWLLSQFSAVQQLERQRQSLLLQRRTCIPQQQEGQWKPEVGSSHPFQEGEHGFNEDLMRADSCPWLSTRKRFVLTQLLHAPAAAALPQLEDLHALVPVLHFLIVFSGTGDFVIGPAARSIRADATSRNPAALTAAAAPVTATATLAAARGEASSALYSEPTSPIAPSEPPACTAAAAATPEAVGRQLLLQRAYLQRLLFLTTRAPARAADAASFRVPGQNSTASAGAEASPAAATPRPCSNPPVAALAHDRTTAAACSSSGSAPRIPPVAAAAVGRRGSSTCRNIAAPVVRSICFLLQDATEAHARICVTYLSSLKGRAAATRSPEAAEAVLRQQQLLRRYQNVHCRPQIGQVCSTGTASVAVVRGLPFSVAASFDYLSAADTHAAPADGNAGADVCERRIEASGVVATAPVLSAAKNTDGTAAATDAASVPARSGNLACTCENPLTAQAAGTAAPRAAARTADVAVGAPALPADATAAETCGAACIETAFHCVLLELLLLQCVQESVPLRPENVQYLFPCMLRAAAAISSLFAVPCVSSLLRDVPDVTRGKTCGAHAAADERLGTLRAAVASSGVSSFSSTSFCGAARTHSGVAGFQGRRSAASASEHFTAAGEAASCAAAAFNSIGGAVAAAVTSGLSSTIGCLAEASASDDADAAAAAARRCITAAGPSAAFSFPPGVHYMHEATGAAAGQQRRPGHATAAASGAARQQDYGGGELSGAVAAMGSSSAEENDSFTSTAAAAGSLLFKAACADELLAGLLLQRGIPVAPPVLHHDHLPMQHRKQQQPVLQRYCNQQQEQEQQQQKGVEQLQTRLEQWREVGSQLPELDNYGRNSISKNTSLERVGTKFLRAVQQQLLLPIICHLCDLSRLEQYRRVVRSNTQRDVLRPAVTDLLMNCEQMLSCCVNHIDQSCISGVSSSSSSSTSRNTGSGSCISGAEAAANLIPVYQEHSNRSSGANGEGGTGSGSKHCGPGACNGSVHKDNSEKPINPRSRFSSSSSCGNTITRRVDGKTTWQQQVEQLHEGLLRLSKILV